MYWPPLIDGAELMMAPTSVAASNTMARAISSGSRSMPPCDRSSLVRDQLAATNSISASHNDQALALSFDSVRYPAQ